MNAHLPRTLWSILTIGALLLSGCGGGTVQAPSAVGGEGAATAAPASASAPTTAAAPTSAGSSAPTAASVAAPTTPAPGNAAGPITIVHWQHSFDARDNIVKQLAQEFQAANPNIKIDFQPIPYSDYFQKIGPSLEAGNGPDVLQLPGPLVREFNDRGQLAPVPESVYTPAEIESNFVPWTIKLLKQEGTYVGLPTDVQSLVAFYNDDLFREAGLDPSKTLETYDEFAAAAEKLTKRDGDTLTQAGADVAASPYQWYWSFMTTGSPKGVVDPQTLKVTYNNEQGNAAWEWLTSLVTKQKVDSAEFLAGQDRFLLGKAGINMHEYTYAGKLKSTAPNLKFSIHPPPHAAGQPVATGGTHWALVVSEKSKNKEAAWSWIKFLTSEASQRKWIAGGGELPSLKSLYQDQSLRNDPVVAAGLDSMQYAQPFNAYGWDDVYAIQQAIWDNVVLNKQDVKTAVQTAAQAEEKLYQDKKIKPSS